MTVPGIANNTTSRTSIRRPLLTVRARRYPNPRATATTSVAPTTARARLLRIDPDEPATTAEGEPTPAASLPSIINGAISATLMTSSANETLGVRQCVMSDDGAERERPVVTNRSPRTMAATTATAMHRASRGSVRTAARTGSYRAANAVNTSVV